MTNEEAMALALEEATLALRHDDVPVGAILVGPNGEVLARAHNEREVEGDPTAHAEMLALTRAAAALRAASPESDWRLLGTTLFVTLEPCFMCAGALVAARVERVVYGASDPKAGAAGSLYDVCSDERLNHQVKVESGTLAESCGLILKQFFAARRRARRTE